VILRKKRNDQAQLISSGYSQNTGQDGETEKLTSKHSPAEIKLKENEITKLRYIKDIGLIGSAFNGTIKIFDAFSFQ
jgi:WD40 repeat protein